MPDNSQRSASRQQSLFDCSDYPSGSPGNPASPSTVDASTMPAVAQSSAIIKAVPGATEGLAGKSIYVLDISLLMFQYFHAIPQMTSPRGQPTNCVFGLVRDLLHLLDERHADGIIAAMDLPGKTFRDELLPSYKETRATTPPELIEQFPLVERLLDSLGIPRIGLPGFEADDILASAARHIEREGGDCFVVTLDKDCRQLISERIRIYDIRKQQEMGAAELQAQWGVRPDQVVDYQALVGDAVDNVPGVPLVGPKLASQLLNQYGTLQGIYDHLEEMAAGKRKSNLEQARASVLLSRTLVELRGDLELPIRWDNLSTRRLDFVSAAALASELGFRKFTEVFRIKSGIPSVIGPRKAAEVIRDSQSLKDLALRLRGESDVAMIVIGDDARSRWAQAVGYALAWSDGACFVPIERTGSESRPSMADSLGPLQALFAPDGPSLIGYDLKYDLIVLRSLGMDQARAGFDAILAAYVLDSGSRDLTLVSLAQKYADSEFPFEDELVRISLRTKDVRSTLHLAEAAIEQARVTLHLRPILHALLDASQLLPLMQTLELPLVAVLAEMEFHGIRVDPQRLAELSHVFGLQLKQLESEIYALAGHAFNVASPKQLSVVLFEELKLPGIKKTKSGQSTDMEVLEQLALVHPLPAKIIEFRHYSKLKGTYVDSLPELIHPVTRRIHTSFSQVSAATGRLSSADPNLQNIPIRSEAGHEIRSAFVAEGETGRLLAADYSQIELRVLAHFSQDASLLEAFANNEDIHTRVAGEIHGVGASEVTSAMRRIAKTVNFGVIYGQSAFGLAKSLKIETDEASRFINAYFGRYPGIVKFMDEVLDACLRQGYVTTLAGRRRPIDGVRPAAARSIHQRNLSERTAINSVIQGSAADLMKQAMIHVHQRIHAEGSHARLLLQIHDELLLEVDSAEIPSVAQWVRYEMEHAYSLAVPLRVDVEVGSHWANCETWE